MNTLGTNTAASNLPIEESYAIALRFKSPVGVAIPKGIPVKLNGTLGEVIACTAGTDKCIGYTTTGTKGVYDDREVTVMTQFVAESLGEADGGITMGDYLICTGVNVAGDKAKVKTTTTAGHLAIGIALTTVLTTATVRYGILRTNVKIS